jgi:NADH:ubiquinone oxidoreductase subunit C
MDIDAIPSLLNIDQEWVKREDGLWLFSPSLNVTKMAELMIENGNRFVSITAISTSREDCRLFYHWDCGGQLLNFVTHSIDGGISSITPLCPAADWVEREIMDYFACEFSGHPSPGHLMLRDGDRRGIFNKEE